MHHKSAWGPGPERECGDEVHILGKKIEPVWPFLDGLALSEEILSYVQMSIKYLNNTIRCFYIGF